MFYEPVRRLRRSKLISPPVAQVSGRRAEKTHSSVTATLAAPLNIPPNKSSWHQKITQNMREPPERNARAKLSVHRTPAPDSEL